MSLLQAPQRQPRPAVQRSWWRKKRYLIPAWFLGMSAGVYQWNAITEVGAGLAFAGIDQPVSSVQFWSDLSWRDDADQRQVTQQIFDQAISMIRKSRRFILLDMFLYNDFQGPEPENTRKISAELTAALLIQKQQFPDMQITVITDPINTVYGGIQNTQFEQLKAAGIVVVLTDLAELRDSNPVYSLLWRYLIKPFGNVPGNTLPNPFGAGRVTLRSYLRMINFKANHRKILVTDTQEGEFQALITSANPHDGSSAHRNVAVSFSGPAAMDVIKAEAAVLALSAQPVFETPALGESGSDHLAGVTVQLLTEKRIKEKVLELLSVAGPGTSVDLLMFYLSDRDVVAAFKAASRRGAAIRVILDVNRDAFGRKKNGIPNKPVAQELVDSGIDVRWCDTLGEQCHAKMLLVTDGSVNGLLQGSANFTRRNLDNYNLETDILIVGKDSTQVIQDARSHFNQMWENEIGKTYSVAYVVHADSSSYKKWLYRFMEATGLSTF